MNTIKRNPLLYSLATIVSIQLMSLGSCGKTAQLNKTAPTTPPIQHIVGANNPSNQEQPAPQKQEPTKGNKKELSPEEVAKKKVELEKQSSQAGVHNSSIDITDEEIKKVTSVMHSKLVAYYSLPGNTKPEKLGKDLIQAQEKLKKYESKLKDLKREYKPYKINLFLVKNINNCNKEIVKQKYTIKLINGINSRKISQLKQHEMLN